MTRHLARSVGGSDAIIAVLDLVGSIPAGRVMAYGDVAGVLGIASPRQVGRILAQHGHGVAWQRVVRADGSLAPPIRREQLARLRAEGTPLAGDRVDLRRARWSPPP